MNLLVLTGIRASARRMRDSRMEWKWPGGAERQNCPGVRFPKASLANYGGKSHWTLLVTTELATIVAFGKRTPVQDFKCWHFIYICK